MSQAQVYLYANCSSCKNAEQVLKAAGIDYSARDLFQERLSVDELRTLFNEIGKQPSELVSRRSIPYRSLKLADRETSDEELLALMAEHPGLLRRPIIITPHGVQIGFNRTALESLAQRMARG